VAEATGTVCPGDPRTDRVLAEFTSLFRRREKRPSGGEDALKARENRTTLARSDQVRWTARREIMLERRPRRESLREHEPDEDSDPFRKACNDRRCPDIGAGSGGAGQDAAKPVMMMPDRNSTRGS